MSMYCLKCKSEKPALEHVIEDGILQFECPLCGTVGNRKDFSDKRSAGRPRREPTTVVRIPERFKEDVLQYIEELKMQVS